ncbi:MAG: L-sorbosone dehydrogenase [Gemmatimonadetes bacterium]|nr:L-sorbosone dehydrogenase [Gemmatimonadota bacterium]
MLVSRHARAALAVSLLVVPSAFMAAPRHPAPSRTAKPECAADNAGLTLPKGFCAMIVADSLAGVRHIVAMPNGDLFVSSMKSGVVALRDTRGTGRADVIEDWKTGFRSSEVRMHNGYLYVETSNAIVRYPVKAGSLTPAGPADTMVSGFPAGGNHTTKTFVITDDGTMYVDVGSATNSCQVKDRGNESPGLDPCVERDIRAGIWQFRADTPGQKASEGIHFGVGIRNGVALALDPSDHTLYAMQHGRDQLFANWPRLFDAEKSAETPAEELFHVTRAGDDFGWPYCYYDRQIKLKVLAPEYGGDGKTAGRCAGNKGNVASFPGHWAPNGLAFYTGTSFPAKYRNGVFIAFHGSWNRAPLPQAGSHVVFQPMVKGKATGEYEVFAEGFNPLTAGKPGHKPTGLAVAPDGSLLVADDLGGRIYRIIYTGSK